MHRSSLPRRVRAAFTLTEILVVISVIAILAALSFYMFHVATRTGERYENMANAARAQVDRSEADNSKKPAPNGNLLPVDPTRPPAGNAAAPVGTDGQPAADQPVRRPPFTQAPFVPDEYVVTFSSRITNYRAEANRLANQYGGQVLSVLPRIKPGAGLRIPSNQYLAFAADSSIQSIEKNYKVRVRQQTPSTGYQRVFSFPTVPSHGLILRRPFTRPDNDRNLKFKKPVANTMLTIAIMDGGVQSSHPDLNVVRSVGFGGLPNGEDGDGHGTHVAGVAAARDNRFGVRGTYPGAPIWSLKVLDATGSGTLLGVLEGLLYVFDNAGTIRVCNMSFGPPITIPIMDFFVDACALNGVVMVCAAGNDGKPASSSSPGSSNYIVNVAALADSDGRPGRLGPTTGSGPDDTFATFSDWDFKVTVVAPGVNILSTSLNGGYTTSSGTSSSSPNVAGIVALLLDPTTQFGRNERNLFYQSRPGISTTMAAYLRSIATEQIPGILGDPLSYPIVNFKVQ